MSELFQLVDRARAELPTLCLHGAKPYLGSDPDVNGLYDHGQLERCVEWLRTAPRRKTVNLRRSSYGYKHRVEAMDEHRTYIANGVFIAAAIGLGIPYQVKPDSPNVCFALGTSAYAHREVWKV